MGGSLTEQKKDEEVRFMKLDEIHTVKVVEHIKDVDVPQYKDVEVERAILKDVEVEVPRYKDVEVKRCIIKDEDITPLVEQAVGKILAHTLAQLNQVRADILRMIPNIEATVKQAADRAAREILNDVEIKIEADTRLKVE